MVDTAFTTGLTSTAAAASTVRTAGVSTGDVAAALPRRTTALSDRNEAAFLSTFDSGRPALIATERTLFRNLVELPLVGPVHLDATDAGTASARTFYIALVYEIRGADVEPAALTKVET